MYLNSSPRKAWRSAHLWNVLLPFVLLTGCERYGMMSAPNQQQHYYSGRNMAYLQPETTSASISVFNNFDKQHLINKYNLNDFNLEEYTYLGKPLKGLKWAKVTFRDALSKAEHEQRLKAIKNELGVRTVNPNFMMGDGSRRAVGMSDFFSVELKKAGHYPQLASLADQQNVVVFEHHNAMPLWYTLMCTDSTPKNTLETAKYFYKKNFLSSSYPEFFDGFRPHVNPLCHNW